MLEFKVQVGISLSAAMPWQAKGRSSPRTFDQQALLREQAIKPRKTKKNLCFFGTNTRTQAHLVLMMRSDMDGETKV